jgi:hypothetical protein
MQPPALAPGPLARLCKTCSSCCSLSHHPRWRVDRVRGVGLPRARRPKPRLHAEASRQSEEETWLKLVQKLVQLQPFVAVFPQECTGPTCIFWAILTPFSLKITHRTDPLCTSGLSPSPRPPTPSPPGPGPPDPPPPPPPPRPRNPNRKPPAYWCTWQAQSREWMQGASGLDERGGEDYWRAWREHRPAPSNPTAGYSSWQRYLNQSYVFENRSGSRGPGAQGETEQGEAGWAYILPRARSGLFFSLDNQVRKTPSWPRSWANVRSLSLYSHRNAWANLHLLGQPNTLRASVGGEQWRGAGHGHTLPCLRGDASLSPGGHGGHSPER